MNISTHWLASGVLLRSTIPSILVLLGILCGPLPQAKSEQTAGNGSGILRYDPVNDVLAPIGQEELKPGYIYSHFSERLNRRVWSFFQANGEFWYALGDGTTQEAWRLDIRVTTEEALKKLAQVDPQLAREVSYSGRRVYLRLNSDDRWVVTRTAIHPTIYNLETGRRWERVGILKIPESGTRSKAVPFKYIPVVSSYGDRWVVQSGEYVPAERWMGMAHLPDYGISPGFCPHGGF